MKKYILSLLIFTCFYGHSQKPLLTENIFDQKQWVDSVYSSMNIDQKIGQLFTVWVATKYGDEFIAAYTIAINLWFLVAFIIDGYSSAGTILSGKLYGEKSYGVLMKFGNDLTKIGVKIGIIMCIIGFIFYYPLGRIFNNDPVVLQEFYNIFWIVLAMLPLCSIAFFLTDYIKVWGG